MGENRNRSGTRKGGLRRIVTKDYVQSFKSPHVLKNDCCACVFKFFGLSDEYTQSLIASKGHDGMNPDEILYIFQVGYPKYSFWMIRDTVINIDVYTSHVAPANFMFAGIERRDGTRHCIAIGRDVYPNTNTVIVYDVQNSASLEMHAYMQRENVKNIYIIYSSGHTETNLGDPLRINSGY